MYESVLKKYYLTYIISIDTVYAVIAANGSQKYNCFWLSHLNRK